MAAYAWGNPTGPAVLFLHGLGYSSHVWRKQAGAPELAAFRLVAIDLRGHGQSSLSPDDAFDGAMWSSDISATIEQLELRDLTIVAWSYSGLVLGDYLAAHGSSGLRAANLIAAASRTGFAEAYGDFGSGAIPNGLLSDDPVDFRAADLVFVDESASTAGFEAADRAELADIVDGTPRETLRRMLRRTVDHGDTWRDLDLPAVLSHGTNDRINLPVISDRMAGIISPSRLSIYLDDGHLPFWDQPSRFNAELRDLILSGQP